MEPPGSATPPTVAGNIALDCQPVHEQVNRDEESHRFGRTICADVVALGQTLVYNRFGSFNPFGMLYALRRDVAPLSSEPEAIDADACDKMLGTETGGLDASMGDLAGKVRLKDCKRPRPMVLRANVGDVLHVRMANLLKAKPHPDLSADFCATQAPSRGREFELLRKAVSWGDSAQVAHGERLCDRSASSGHRADVTDWPKERGLNFAVQGLSAFGILNGKVVAAPDACVGLGSIPVNRAIDCYYLIEREGPFFLTSTAAPAGGQGDGGSLVHGLFGAVVVENAGTEWFRSQTSQAAFREVWPEAKGMTRHAVNATELKGLAAYRKPDTNGVPILAMLQQRQEGAHEIIHADLNAIVYSPPMDEAPEKAFREFGVFFHDEIKAFYTRNFDELGNFDQLAGARDGFAINYGASGMGTLMLANRKGIGPAANCAECLYEEFFLTSWANGDPALLEHFPDDPSNVHHSYLNDAIVYRNFHAGPKETHVFHLHAHQWFAGNDKGRGAYLDSQTVGPQQGFSYDIYGGGLEVYHAPQGDRPGWFETLGSGNRNRTIGDSIFHCHLYPHFAQGMWELWRVHDVLEDGTRKLPDGQWEPGFSLTENPNATLKRPGSVHRASGRWIEAKESTARRQLGTPVPAIIPLPGQAWPLLPSYTEGDLVLADDGGVADAAGNKPATEDKIAAMPGYPYFVAGEPGHRPPQPPLDLARAVDRGPDAEDATDDVVTDEILDGGLPRHVMLDGSTRKLPFDGRDLPPDLPGREAMQKQLVAKALALGDMTMKLESVALKLIDHAGDPLERSAMSFHGDGAGLTLYDAVGSDVQQVAGSYASRDAAGATRSYAVNGAPPKPGAPFADPCGGPAIARGTVVTDPFVLRRSGSGADFTPDPAVSGYRRYEGSAIQLDLITNRAGWHDPQARINVLSDSADAYKDPTAGTSGRWSPRLSASEQPFFFRALSGECIEFRHTNELPHVLELDDFQVRTPTDTIGQHIHLVKFDVTSSDGSGNGFNYEDGTFAPDEIAHRICAAKNDAGNEGRQALPVPERGPGTLAIREAAGLCEQGADGSWHVSGKFADRIWRLPRGTGTNRDLFQTTVQRWFADPIPSSTGPQGASFDRTLRTVFSHDHFGPSSIQQHGFYTALVIERPAARICNDPDDGTALVCTPERRNQSLILGGPRDVGARKIIVDKAPLDPNAPDFREFALAIADFALLYDPRDHLDQGELEAAIESNQGGDHVKGLATLVCEGQRATDPGKMKSQCGSALSDDGTGWHAAADDAPPAWVAADRPGDQDSHKTGLGNLLNEAEFAFTDAANNTKVTWSSLSLGDRLLRWRRMAAGYDGAAAAAPLARPVSPPQRPESISVDHHDPYLLNYRGEPLPLRVGASSRSDDNCELTDTVEEWENILANGVRDRRCEISTVRTDMLGDPANMLRSGAPPSLSGSSPNVLGPRLHGDPATGVLKANENDPVMIRLIQGAQEVQHSFNIEGYTWPRNLDQAFPSNLPRRDDIIALKNPTLVAECQAYAGPAGPWWKQGRPRSAGDWMRGTARAFAPGGSHANPDLYDYWTKTEQLMSDCFNIEGRVAAQEIGISEHFEFRSAYLHQLNLSGAGAPILNDQLMSARPTPFGLASQLDERIATLRGILRRNQPSDSLVHFGSSDAIWNGAWTLLRVSPRKRLAADDVARLETIIRRLEALKFEALPGMANLGAGVGERVLDALKDADELIADLRFEETAASTVTVPGSVPGGAMQLLAAGPAIRPIEALARDWASLRSVVTPTLDGLHLHRRPAAIPRGPRLAQADQADGLRNLQPAEVIANETRGSLIAPIGTEGQAAGDLAPPAALPSDSQRAPFPKIGRRIDCDPAAPQVYTAVVAIDARSLFGGAAYGGTLSDPDGLFLAVVDPRNLVEPDRRTRAGLDDPRSWEAIPLGTIRSEIKRVYDRAEPMVLNVNAGDCVHVVWVNAMPDAGKGRLPDGPGDAPMPTITSLNVDVDWHGEIRDDEPLDLTAGNRADLAPSNRLAISFPLPIMGEEYLLARPYGMNPTGALRGVPASATDKEILISRDLPGEEYADRSAQIMLTRFYAGLAYGSPVDPEKQLLAANEVATAIARSGLRSIAPAAARGAASSMAAPAAPARVPTVADLVDALMDGPDAPLTLDDLTARQTEQQLARAAAESEAQAELSRLSPRVIETLRRAPAAEPVTPKRGPEVPIVEQRLDRPGFDLRIDDVRVPLAAVADESAALKRLETAEADLALTARQRQERIELATRLAGGALETNFIPYAFGPLPVKPMGDIIGQVPHGLIGSINVVPERATIADTRITRERLDGKKHLDEQDRPGCDIRDVQEILDDPVLGQYPYVKGRPAFNPCRDYVLVPQKPADSHRLMGSSALVHTPGPGKLPGGTPHSIRQFTLFWQDGLNLTDSGTANRFHRNPGDYRLDGDCMVCGDSYDWGETGTSMRSVPFALRLADKDGVRAETHYDFNRNVFGPQFFLLTPAETTDPPVPVLRAIDGEQITVHVVNAGGKARQRAFVTISQDYDDLFHGFGFPRAALLAPGKAMTAQLLHRAKPRCWLWFDGPTHLRAGGTWGLFDVLSAKDWEDGKTSCERAR